MSDADNRCFVIDRATWVHNGNKRIYGEELLLNSEGNMCCLGQIMSRCGFTPNHLEDEPTPSGATPGCLSSLLDRVDFLFDRRLSSLPCNSELTIAAMRINGADGISAARREAELISLFARHGIELTFVGEERGENE